MPYQAVFRRYEIKYMVTPEQKKTILNAMEPYMALDKYGRSVIRNIYFDTDSYRLIRRSIEKPAYKEKLRMRSYDHSEGEVFVELKKKYKHVVYKRRLSMPEEQAMDWLCGKPCTVPEGQIAAEIEYFRQHYRSLHPTVFLAYSREAYYCRDGSGFRVTFDDDILCRQEELSLDSELWGAPLLPENTVLMELKCSGGIPLWMSHVLSEERIYRTSFSKYGTAYRTIIFPALREVRAYA